MTPEARQVEIMRIKAQIGATVSRLCSVVPPLERLGLTLALNRLNEDLAQIEKSRPVSRSKAMRGAQTR
jgi:hypothetical protein